MNARPSHLLDPKLFDFVGLERNCTPFDENAAQLPDLH
jgi:tRNA 2-thiocytidine biosynthesis protein TtcA